MARSKASPPLPLSATKQERRPARRCRADGIGGGFRTARGRFRRARAAARRESGAPSKTAQPSRPAPRLSRRALRECSRAISSATVSRSIGDADEFLHQDRRRLVRRPARLVAGLAAGCRSSSFASPTTRTIRTPSPCATARCNWVSCGARSRAGLAPNIDAGDRYTRERRQHHRRRRAHVGVNIHVRRQRASAARANRRRRATATRRSTSAHRADRRARRCATSQHAVLERIEAGRNTLAVLGTGRGKSLCFQLPAAQRALEGGAKTLVFYPLRALDERSVRGALAAPRTLRPAHPPRERRDRRRRTRGVLEAALEDGSWDIVLATPEFATYHREVFARRVQPPGAGRRRRSAPPVRVAPPCRPTAASASSSHRSAGRKSWR